MLVLTSTTDDQPEVARALEASGHVVDSIEEVNNEETPPAVPAVEAQVEAPADKDKTTPAPGTEEPVTDVVEEPKPGAKPPAGVQKRIDELTRDRYVRDGVIAEKDRRIAALEAQAKGEPVEPAAAEVVAADETAGQPAKPLVGDYADYDEFVAALTAWTVETTVDSKVKAILEARDAKTAAKAAETAGTTEWNAKLAEAATRYPDWDAVRAASADVKVSSAMMDAYVEDPRGADVLFYLATHPDDAAKVFAATTYDPETTTPLQVLAKNRAAGKELARIVTLLPAVVAPGAAPAAAAPAAKPKPRAASAAPAPIVPARAGAAAGGTDPYDPTRPMTTPEYNAWRDAHPKG